MAYNHSPTYSLQETDSPCQAADGHFATSQHSSLSGLDHQSGAGPSPQRRSLYYKFVRLGVRLGEWWLPDITSFLIASGLFGLQVSLLLAYNLKPVSSWREESIGWVIGFTTLQSAISLLSTLMRGAIFFPVASAIGQWKWHKYRGKPQSLDELDRFDKASRGMTGSIGYLFSGNFWSPASLGCVIIISGIFFGPSLQNTVRTKPLDTYANFTASLPVARNFESFHFLGQNVNQPSFLVASPFMQASIARGWAFGMSAEAAYTTMSNDVHPYCPGSTCEWDNWSSLQLSSECRPADFEWRSGGYFSTSANVGTNRTVNGNPVQTVVNMAVLPSIPSTSSFATGPQGPAVLAHIGIIGDPHQNGTEAEAVECILYWRAFQGSAISLNGNVTVDKVIDQTEAWRAREGLKTDWDYWGYHNVTLQALWPCGPGTALSNPESSPGDSCNHTATSRAQRGLYNSLVPYLTGYGAFYSDTDSGASFWQGSDQAHDLFLWDYLSERSDGSPIEEALFRTADRHIGNIAYFVSAGIRRESLTPTNGTVLVIVEHFEARYDYLIPPGIIMALSILFFVVAAICTRGDNVWRNSQLPLLYHGLEQTGPKEWRNMQMTAMWEAAYDARVKLETDVNDGGLKLHRYTDLPEKSGKGGYARVSMTPEVVEQTYVMGGKPV